MKNGVRITVLAVTLGLGMTLLPTGAQGDDQASAPEAAIRKAALDYMDGALSADPDRVAQGIHSELNKVRRIRLSPEGSDLLLKAGSSRLLAATQGMTPPAEEWETEVTIFQVGEGIAQARAVSPWFYDLLQLVEWKGEWRIVNVLWEANQLRDGSPFPATDRAAEGPAVRQAALDYIDGFFSGDAERMDRALSSQLNKVLLAGIPGTGVQLLDYSSKPLLVEATRGGSGNLPEAERGIEVTVHDISHGLASVSLMSSQFIDHIHLAKLNGEWKVVNVLWVPNPS